MMQQSYWSKFTNQRIGRRRALAISGGTALGAAFLAACGGGDDEGGKEDVSGLVAQPKDTFNEAKRGGTLKYYIPAEPRSLDTSNPQADLNNIAPEVYSALFIEKPAKLESSGYELQGDLAQSFEISNDGLQITAKLRPNVKFHNLPPVNGRTLDAEDVIASWKYYVALAPLAALVANASNPDAPVLDVTAPDSRTIVIKVKEPVAYVANWFASFGSYTGQILMYPKEIGSTFDIRNSMIGTGPWYLKSHQPSVGFVLGRHADYWDKDFALVDEVSVPVVSEYAARGAQLRAGQIHFSDADQTVRQEDILTLKRDEPRILLYESDLAPDASVMTFGHLPIGRSKLQDERVRQAISMSFDRDLYIAVQYNTDTFKKEGLPVETAWNSHLAARPPFIGGGWFLDPLDEKEFGPNAKYFRHDIAEAKKLLSAAGYPNGFDLTVHYPAAPQFNRATLVEPFISFFQDLGLKVIQNAEADYTTGYIPKNRDASGEFEGIGYHSVTGGIPSTVSPESAMVAEYWPRSGVTFHGFDVNGRGDKSGDPVLTDMLTKARIERDVETRKKLIRDAQRHLGKAMHAMLAPGGATGFWAAWPAVKNFRVTRSVAQSWRKYQIWLDTSQPPFV